MSIRRISRYLTVIAATVATAVAAFPVTATEQPGLVRVESGWLRGVVADDHVTYSAIPYAAPPVGERRWRPPIRPHRWSGVWDATTPSPLCPQTGDGEVIGREDCLFLDVTAPRHKTRLPVLVWVHGGGLDSGGAQRFDGTRLATQGGMVVVTVNYRLGALGFLSTPELDGNYGLMDQTAALEWVRRNASRFGGNPHDVTLAGQSAGGRAVCAQLASPAARGLFDRAITQSGACDNDVLTPAAAHAFGDQALRHLGCDDAACLRLRTPADLVGTLDTVGFAPHGRATDRPWNPVAGTRFLPRQPRAALRDGTAARVPLLVGGTRDEMRGFLAGREVRYEEMVTETFGDRAADVLAEYPGHDRLTLATLLSDWGGRIGACPVLRTAEAAAAHQPVHAYEFAEDSGQFSDDFPLGSYHGLDLPYLWTLNGFTPYPPLTPAQERLSTTMIGYWSAFVHTGDPNGPGRPHWPAFDTTGTVIGLSSTGIAPTPFAEDHRCGFWAGLPR